MNTRHTIRGAGDQREVGWSAGSGKSQVDRWRLEAGCQLLEVGCQLLEVGCWLMEGDYYLLDVVASNTVSVIRTATSAVRLLLTYQRTTPWKASGAGVAAQRTHSWSVATQYKISSLVTAVSTSLWLAVAGAPQNSSLATPQQADFCGIVRPNFCIEQLSTEFTCAQHLYGDPREIHDTLQNPHSTLVILYDGDVHATRQYSRLIAERSFVLTKDDVVARGLSSHVYTTFDHDANDLIGQCIAERVDHSATQ